MYQLSNEKIILKFNGDRVDFIPFDPANTDYQEYLRFLAEGNEPLPPDEPETTE